MKQRTNYNSLVKIITCNSWCSPVSLMPGSMSSSADPLLLDAVLDQQSTILQTRRQVSYCLPHSRSHHSESHVRTLPATIYTLDATLYISFNLISSQVVSALSHPTAAQCTFNEPLCVVRHARPSGTRHAEAARLDLLTDVCGARLSHVLPLPLLAPPYSSAVYLQWASLRRQTRSPRRDQTCWSGPPWSSHRCLRCPTVTCSTPPPPSPTLQQCSVPSMSLFASSDTLAQAGPDMLKRPALIFSQMSAVPDRHMFYPSPS